MKTFANVMRSANMIPSLMIYLLLLSFCLSAKAQEAMDTETSPVPTEAMDTNTDQPVAASSTPQGDDSNIARAQFTTAVVDREPTDDITTVNNDIGQVYFFTEIVDAQGETYTHRWEYEGQQMAEVTFDIGGPRWRVYSTKSIKPELTGMWTVTVLDTTGTPVKVSNIEVVAAQPMSQPMN